MPGKVARLRSIGLIARRNDIAARVNGASQLELIAHNSVSAQITCVRASRRAHAGLTILELLICLAILAILFALIFPAVQAARESARNLACLQNQHELGLALQDYHDCMGSLPPGWAEGQPGKFKQAWGAAVLDRLGQTALQVQIRAALQSGAPVAPPESWTLPAFLCPSDLASSQWELYEENAEHEEPHELSEVVLARLPQANYLGVFGSSDPDDVAGGVGEGTFLDSRPVTLLEITRGTSNVLLVGERTARKLPSTWLGFAVGGEDAPSRVVGYADLGPNRDDADECEFDSRHPGGANFLWGDGHAAVVSSSIESGTYRELSHRHPAESPASISLALRQARPAAVLSRPK